MWYVSICRFGGSVPMPEVDVDNELLVEGNEKGAASDSWSCGQAVSPVDRQRVRAAARRTESDAVTTFVQEDASMVILRR